MRNIIRRSGLPHTRRAIEAGALTVGFIGGSITDARVRHNWPEHVAAWLNMRWPELRLRIENAAIGATGSDLAVFRAERDLLARACDLVFVEFAVNDLTLEADIRMRSREGLLRKLLADGHADVVLVYTHSPAFLDDLQGGRIPPSVAEFERLAERYRLTSVWVGRYAWEQVCRGRARMEQWLPDGLHPQFYGGSLYAEAVIALLEGELDGPDCAPCPPAETLPVPLIDGHWADAKLLSWEQVAWHGSWQLQASHSWVWVDYVLHTHAPGASLTFSFTGRGFAVFQDFGSLAAAFELSVDGGPAEQVRFTYESWCGEHGWIRGIVRDDLPVGPHTVALTARHSGVDGRTGCDLDLLYLGVLTGEEDC